MLFEFEKTELNSSEVLLNAVVGVTNIDDSIILKISFARMQKSAATRNRFRRWNGFKPEGKWGREHFDDFDKRVFLDKNYNNINFAIKLNS